LKNINVFFISFVVLALHAVDDITLDEEDHVSTDYLVNDDGPPVLLVVLASISSVFIIFLIAFIILQYFYKPKKTIRGRHYLIGPPTTMENTEYFDRWWESNSYRKPLRACSSPAIITCEEDHPLRHSRSVPLNDDNLEEHISFLSHGSVTSSSIFSISRVASAKHSDHVYNKI